MPQVKGVPLVRLSGLAGTGVPALMDAVIKAYKVWNTRIPTAQLNRWLEKTLERHPPPAVSGRRLKIRYATQPKTRPPHIAIFSSRPDAIPPAYIRYLTNNLREAFDLPGTPIRIAMRGGDNPYHDKSAKKS